MKKISIIITSLLWLNSFTQNVQIKGAFDQASFSREVSLFRPAKFTEYASAGANEVISVTKGKFLIKLNVDQAEIIYITSYVNDTLEFKQPLFLKKGYKLFLEFKIQNGLAHLTVTGIGAQDNQALQLSAYDNLNDYSTDTVPDNVYTYTQKVSEKNTVTLANYITTQNPSADFIKIWNYELQYSPVNAYYSFAQQRKFYIKNAYKRNIKKWDDALAQLLSDAPLVNNDALVSATYRLFLKDYLLRSKEQLWQDARDNMETFAKKWYGDDIAKGEADFTDDIVNKLCQKIIEKYFTGKVKEYLYSCLIKEALESSVVNNIASIYADFSKEFPESKYKKLYDSPIATMIKKLQHPLTEKMFFVPHSDSLNTWAEVLSIFKGKTVLLDMWGTWCGPCREEIEKHGAAIKSYFKGKNLDYLYIANFDENNIKQWKRLVAYFNMEGNHILANKKLTADIMKAIKGNGYPTYVIIQKDGSFELSKAGYPMNRQQLIEQIEATLQ